MCGARVDAETQNERANQPNAGAGQQYRAGQPDMGAGQQYATNQPNAGAGQQFTNYQQNFENQPFEPANFAQGQIPPQAPKKKKKADLLSLVSLQ